MVKLLLFDREIKEQPPEPHLDILEEDHFMNHDEIAFVCFKVGSATLGRSCKLPLKYQF